MEVAKTFDRAGVRYRPGDPLPEGLDRQTLEHYKRYGMVREVRTPGPAEKKPAAPGSNTGATPLTRPSPKPEENKNVGGTGVGSDSGAAAGKQPEGVGQPGAADGQQSGAVDGEVRTPVSAEKKPAAPGKNTGASQRKRAGQKPEVNMDVGGLNVGSDSGAADDKQPEGAVQSGVTEGQQSVSETTGQQASDENSNDAGQKQV